MSPMFPWYDSPWITKYVLAKEYLRNHCPERLNEFISALSPLRTRPDFEVLRLKDVFDEVAMRTIRDVIANLKPQNLELHEIRSFGRWVVHDHPILTELQNSMTELVSHFVGERVEASYNFLSMYTKLGRCPIHMDSPQAKWTLDVCIDQSEPWPIHFSQILPWPEELELEGEDWHEQIRMDSRNNFTAYTLNPGEAVLFSGSSQWHYRDPLPRKGSEGSCELLFFHYIPNGMRELIKPENWPRIFRLPELVEILK